MSTLEEEEARRRLKQKKKMTKMLNKLWDAADPNPFHNSDSGNNHTANLSRVGQRLDAGKYQDGKRGWEKFAVELGKVYGRHLGGSGKTKKLAQKHLDMLSELLTKLDPSGALSSTSSMAAEDVAKSNNSSNHHSSSTANSAKKRKSTDESGGNTHSVKNSKMKMDGGNGSSHHHDSNEPLTIAQREERAMDNLLIYLRKEFQCNVSETKDLKLIRARVTQRPNNEHRYDTVFISPEGRILKSKNDVARFLKLDGAGGGPAGTSNAAKSSATSTITAAASSSSSAVRAVNVGKGRPRSQRELEAEKKRLKRELDKLLKAHGKATKALDEYSTEHQFDRYPIDDDLLAQEELNKQQQQQQQQSQENGNASIPTTTAVVKKTAADVNPDLHHSEFPNIPHEALPDLLSIWDFLNTFSRTLSLTPVPLCDFVAALTYTQQYEEDIIPVYLAEAHLALLKLLLSDVRSDEWWWSTLPDESDAAAANIAAPGGEAANSSSMSNNNTSNSSSSSSANKARNNNNNSDGGGVSCAAPTIKVDLAQLLAHEEDPMITTRWIQALEDVRLRKTNSGGPIKHAIKSAMSITTNLVAKNYLKRALKKWKGNSAGITKRAVVWLVDRVREARPDLWGRQLSDQALNAQKKAVADRAAKDMVLVKENAKLAEAVVDSDDGFMDDDDDDESGDDDSDGDESDDDDDDSDDNEPEEEPNDKSTTDLDHQHQPLSFTIPPTIVDLLLPPAKPATDGKAASGSSDIITPLTWPYLVGASTRRILNYYKKQRTELDDVLRKRNMRPDLSIVEQRRRVGQYMGRILSECVLVPDLNFKSNDNNNNNNNTTSAAESIEASIEMLLMGGSYETLNPLQKLGLLRILVEAAYDTYKVHQCVADNFNSRTNALKSLEAEQRRAKKQAKDELAQDEARAREYLAADVREAFIGKKRREMIESGRYASQGGEHVVNEMTDEEVIDALDEEDRADYDTLPKPSSFPKTEVSKMVAKNQEAAAFDTRVLVVLSLEEIQAREEEKMNAVLEEIDSSYKEGESMDRETSGRINSLRKEVDRMRKEQEKLPDQRAIAMEVLQESLESGTIKGFRNAIRAARTAKLMGPDEETGGVWALDLFRDVALEMRSTERRKKVIDLQKDLVAKRDKCFVRTEPLGYDRDCNSFWHLSVDERSSTVWREHCSKQQQQELSSNDTTDNEQKSAAALEALGPPEYEVDYLRSWDDDGDTDDATFQKFCRMEYHKSGQLSNLPASNWGCFTTDRSLRRVIKLLDERGIRENALKKTLKEMLEASGSGDNDNANVDVLNKGDEEAFQTAKQSYVVGEGEASVSSVLGTVTSAIDQRIRRKLVEDGGYEMGTITGWFIMQETITSTTDDNDDVEGSSVSNNHETVHHNEEDENMPIEPTTTTTTTKTPIWRVVFDNGHELDLNGVDLLEGLLWAHKFKEGKDCVELDAPFIHYRNIMGRYCGKNANEAFASSTPLALSKLMMRKENDMYSKIKNRTYSNAWGQRTGMRNIWIQTLKDEGSKFSIVQSCLVTLENAMYDLIDGIDHDDVAVPPNILDAATNNNEAESSSNGDNIHELLQSPSFRSELELESIGQKMTSLWTSAQVRSVFLAIVQHATELGVLALCLDLLHRNCTAYIKSNTVKKSSRSASRANTDKGGVADVDRDYYYEDEYGVTDDMYQPRPSRSRLNRSQRPQEGFYTDFF